MSDFSVLLLHEIRQTRRKRWLWLYIVAFGALCALVSVGSIAVGRVSGVVSFGPTAATLINLNLVVVSLMSLLAGALSIVADRENQVLSYLASLPITIGEIFSAKLVALFVGLSSAVGVGFAISFLVMSYAGASGNIGDVLQFALQTWLLMLCTASLGVLISVLSRTTVAAIGIAIVVWLGLILLGDLGIMAGALTLHLGTQGLLFLTLANPLEAYKIASVAALSGSVDVLGPGGRLATDLFGAALMPLLSFILLAWSLASLTVARVAVGKRDVA